MTMHIIRLVFLITVTAHSALSINRPEPSGLRLKSGLQINLKAPTKPSSGSFDFSRIAYDTKLQMLVFPDRDSFQKAIDALDDYTQRFQPDNGNTSEFLSTLRQTNKVTEAFIATLEKNSPLSDAVLEAFLNANPSVPYLKRVLEANLSFSERVEGVYNKTPLPNDIRTAIDRKRYGQTPGEIVLDAFERRFRDYRSYRTAINSAEYKYLIGGGNPLDKANPANGSTLDRTISSVLNDRKEVKIGKSICLILSHSNVEIVNGDPKVLAYIRTHQAIPINKLLPNEPENGFPISQAPPFVDPNIVVQPTDRENGCGVDVSTGGPQETGRIAYHTTAKGTAYYWDFGDGFVSYKQSPTHQFVGKPPGRPVTVTVYNDLGARCGPQSVGHSPGTTGNNGQMCSGSVTLNISSAGVNITGTATAVGFAGGEYYRWDFGDGTSAAGAGYSVAPHSYSAAGQYTVTVSVNDLNMCSANAIQIVNVAGSAGTGTAADCCDAREREHEGALQPDQTHSFNHKLAIQHFGTFTCRLHAEVVSYKAVYFFGSKIWFWSGTTSNVDINGNVFSPDTNDKCSVATVVGLTQPYNGIWNSLNYPFPSQVRVKRDTIQSNGGAFGGNTTVTISDCD